MLKHFLALFVFFLLAKANAANCVSTYRDAGPTGFYTTACTNQTSFKTSLFFGKGWLPDFATAQTQISNQLLSDGMRLAGIFFNQQVLVHVDSSVTPKDQVCVLAQMSANWDHEAQDFLDCGDGALISLKGGAGGGYLTTKGYQLQSQQSDTVQIFIEPWIRVVRLSLYVKH